MGIISKMRKGYAVYWAPGPPDNYGKTTYPTAPIEIRCRWDDTVVTFIDGEGEERNSQAVVYVDRELALKGVLWRGRLVDLSSQSPMSNDGAWEIHRLDQNPNFKHTETLLTAYL